MFKRMSVLVRRSGDDRATFSRGWERHAAPVKDLPRVRGYVQNHVEEEFAVGAAPPIEVDGFVELLWDRPEDMAEAFASPAARPMVADEPNFLGHGSGYALKEASALRDATGGKLVVAALAVNDVQPMLKGLEEQLRGLPGVELFLRDDVDRLIPKPGMAPPQPVNAFFHLYFADVAGAGAAAHHLAEAAPSEGLRLGVYRVRTMRFV